MVVPVRVDALRLNPALGDAMQQLKQLIGKLNGNTQAVMDHVQKSHQIDTHLLTSL